MLFVHSDAPQRRAPSHAFLVRAAHCGQPARGCDLPSSPSSNPGLTARPCLGAWPVAGVCGVNQ